jgi:hypothetical protein
MIPPWARLSPEEWSEIERRAIDHEQHPESAVPWEEVRAGLLRSIGRTE